MKVCRLGRADLASATDVLRAAVAAAPGLALSATDAAAVAEEKLFGDAPGAGAVALGAWIDRKLAGVAVVSARWLRLVAVIPERRRRGIGTALLAAAESEAKGAGARELRTGDQPGNYLLPGVAEADYGTAKFFARHGYARVAARTSLMASLANLSAMPAAAVSGYRLRRATPADKAALIAPVCEAFSEAWAFELAHALAARPPAVLVAETHADGGIAGFAAHDGQNRGLGHFGPAGVFAAHRRRGLGTALARAVFADLAAAGFSRTVIPWVGSRDFYARAVGNLAEQRYIVMAKRLFS